MSNYILLNNEVELFYFIELILFGMLSVAAILTIFILKKWDFSQHTSFQYNLEKKSYLVNTIIYFSLIVKIIFIGYFIYTVDLLAHIIPGAMCATGVFNFNEYGNLLLVNKIILLVLSLLWIIVNYFDLKQKSFPYFKTKSILFLFIGTLVVSEMILDILFFSNLSTQSLATCCSILYDTSKSSPIPFGLEINSLIWVFYIIFMLQLLFNYKKQLVLSVIGSVFFTYISYFSLIYFFGTYIYQLPTHHCPYCMLQREYLYIGYLIFGTLFIGVFFSIANGFLKLFLQRVNRNFFLYSNLGFSLFTIIVTAYVVVYYLKNGVFL